MFYGLISCCVLLRFSGIANVSFSYKSFSLLLILSPSFSSVLNSEVCALCEAQHSLFLLLLLLLLALCSYTTTTANPEADDTEHYVTAGNFRIACYSREASSTVCTAAICNLNVCVYKSLLFADIKPRELLLLLLLELLCCAAFYLVHCLPNCNKLSSHAPPSFVFTWLLLVWRSVLLY